MSFFNYIRKITGDRAESMDESTVIGSRDRAPLTVQLIGEVHHPDFRDALSLIRADARIVDGIQPEVIVIAQSRPDVIGRRDVERIRQRVPLAGLVGLMGTWCEGETRTGRPWHGVTRLYWYEFPAWWRRQRLLRAAGRCPDWARPSDSLSVGASESLPRLHGVVELCVPRRETANAMADVLQSAGYATVWHRAGEGGPVVRGVVAGIWDGGQLEDREADDLKAFCRRLQRQRARAIALLDFPRRDRADRALELGAAAVMGKPWLNENLLLVIEDFISSKKPSEATSSLQAA